MSLLRSIRHHPTFTPPLCLPSWRMQMGLVERAEGVSMML